MAVGAGSVPSQRTPALARYLDVLLLAVGAPVAVALGAPLPGCAIGAGAWVGQRILAHTDRRWISRSREPRVVLALNLLEAFGRIWLLAGAIVAAGVLGGRSDGLAAALVILGAYSMAFAVKVITGPPPGRAVR